jgi:hypothetical protein
MRKALALLLGLCAPAAAQDITAATLTQPTGRYDHAILGDALEWGALDLTLANGKTLRFTLPPSRVFEDITARLADLDDDGHPEVLVVETDLRRGASLAIYNARGKRAATAFIGQTHRWLAPAGWGDFDADGRSEIAYIDRPHLARELVFLRYSGRSLTEIARATGFTNHRIGDKIISGGALHCPGKTTLLLASPDWSRLLEVRLQGNTILNQDRGPLAPDSFTAAQPCLPARP